VPLAPLPIDPFIPEIVARVNDARAAVIVAAPGAGKTTRVPPALAATGPVILLQPRRVAARSIASRIAEEQGWTIGREVGWHVRFDQRFGPDTRLLVATEGILTARLQQDPLLSQFHTIILDEFHERSIHADLGIALARQAWLARDDLRLVVMSATIAAEPVAAYLGNVPIIDVPGRGHPLEIAYSPNFTIAEAVRDVAPTNAGQVLCFLPGAPEIYRALWSVQTAVASFQADVVPLHGGLDSAEQDRALAPVTHRRIILATNIAETSLTVPGVSAVVDSGLHKVARYDPERAIDSLETERISQDSADQRAGRAGRLGPGAVRRLWSETDRLRLRRQADIHRIDLSGPLLDIVAWGGDPRTLDWFETPAPEALDAAFELLRRLGAIDGVQITARGREMQRLPLHPRLARILLSARGSWEAALSCALLSERHFLAPRTATTSSDLLSAVERERDLPPHVVRVAKELHRQVRGRSSVNEDEFRRAVLDGYPDRVARRRAPGSPRLLLTSGHGAVLGPESGVSEGEYLVAIDVQAGRRGEGSEARVRVASAVDKRWLEPTDVVIHHEIDAHGAVRAVARDLYGALVLVERVTSPDPVKAAALLADAYLARGLSDEDQQLFRRLRFAGVKVDSRELVAGAAARCRTLNDIDLARDLPWQVRQDLDRLAPPRLTVPSGRTHALEYQQDGTVVASIKLQELFGLAETPRIGPHSEPVLIALLAPNGRPVQRTRDLRSFWANTYPGVRKELRGRYPRHPWPDDPWTAMPTARTKK
jgi:ATP-dependent helicase HrpB